MIGKSLLQLLIVLLAAHTLSAEVLSDQLKPLWNTWKQIYQTDYYAFTEESSRFAAFVDNYKKIVAFNANSGSHPNAVKLALNKFADLTEDEFKYLHTGGYLEHQKTRTYTDEASFIDYSLLQLPSSVDWRMKSAVTPVKNQQRCGSCWSFAAVGALESFYFLNHGKLLTFSEQQIVDCDTKDGGCHGGLPERAFEYTARVGLETEADYPYTAVDGKCHYDESKAIKVNSGHRCITTRSVSALKAALAVQPVSVAIEADQDVFRFYKSGVIKASTGCGADLNHAVLAVGYTSLEGDETFIVKNSWGSDWGADGYVHISTEEGANRGKGVCGILGEPVVPTACKNEKLLASHED